MFWGVGCGFSLFSCFAFLDGKAGSLLGSAMLLETPLGHKAQAGLQSGQDCPLHIEKSLIILSSTSADLIRKNISNPLPEFPKEQVLVGLRNSCVMPAGISNEGPHSTSQQRAGIPLPRGVHAHGSRHQHTLRVCCHVWACYMAFGQRSVMRTNMTSAVPFLLRALLNLELGRFTVD